MDLETAQTLQNSQSSGSNNWKRKLLILIFVILGAVILIEILWAGRILLTPVSKTGEKFPEVGGGRITLLAPQKDYKLNENIKVTIGLSTGDSVTDGADVVIKYDPKVLEATAGAFEKGTIYPEYPNIQIDPKEGMIQLSGISSTKIGSTFGGVGVFGRLSFKAKSAGAATLSVEFAPGATNDSNIIESKSGKDVLESVSNLNLNIK